MYNTLLELITKIVLNKTPDEDAITCQRFHELLKIHYYTLSHTELFELGNFALSKAESKIEVYKIILTCFSLAWIKPDKSSSTSARLEPEIFDKLLGLRKLLENQPFVFNANYNELYSAELWEVERQITIDGYINGRVIHLKRLSQFYLNLAINIGNLPGYLVLNFGAANQRLINSTGNMTYLMKSIAYNSIALRAVDDPYKQLYLQINKYRIIMQVLLDKNKNGTDSAFYSQYTKLLADLLNRLNVNNIEEIGRQFVQHKNAILALSDPNISLFLSYADKVESDINNTLLTINNINEGECFLLSGSKALESGENSPKNIKSLLALVRSNVVTNNLVCKYQLALYKQYKQQLFQLKAGKPVVINTPIEISIKYKNGIQKINENIALSQFYLTVETILTLSSLISFATTSGKLSIKAHDLFNNTILADFTKLTDAIAEFCTTANISNDSLNAACQISSLVALMLTLTYENQINKLYEAAIANPDSRDLATSADAITFAIFTATMALTKLAILIKQENINELEKSAFQIVAAIKNYLLESSLNDSPETKCYKILEVVINNFGFIEDKASDADNLKDVNALLQREHDDLKVKIENLNQEKKAHILKGNKLHVLYWNFQQTHIDARNKLIEVDGKLKENINQFANVRQTGFQLLRQINALQEKLNDHSVNQKEIDLRMIISQMYALIEDHQTYLEQKTLMPQFNQPIQQKARMLEQDNKKPLNCIGIKRKKSEDDNSLQNVCDKLEESVLRLEKQIAVYAKQVGQFHAMLFHLEKANAALYQRYDAANCLLREGEDKLRQMEITIDYLKNLVSSLESQLLQSENNLSRRLSTFNEIKQIPQYHPYHVPTHEFAKKVLNWEQKNSTDPRFFSTNQTAKEPVKRIYDYSDYLNYISPKSARS